MQAYLEFDQACTALRDFPRCRQQHVASADIGRLRSSMYLGSGACLECVCGRRVAQKLVDHGGARETRGHRALAVAFFRTRNTAQTQVAAETGNWH